jgi:putative ABC transport system permease protein
MSLAVAVVLVELTLPYFSSMAGKTLTLASGSSAWIRFGLPALALAVGVLAGAYPAFYLSGFRPVSVLQGDSLPGSGRPGLRKVLVVMQFTISVTIIFSTIIVKDQLDFIHHKRLGFDKEHVVVIRTADSSFDPDSRPFRDAILQSSNVLSAAASSNLPGGSDWGMSFYLVGDAGEEKQSMRTLVVDENFVKTMKMEIVAGRDFSEKNVTDADEALLVNEKAFATYGLQLGQKIRRVHDEDENGNMVWRTGRIVGVVRDFHFRSLHEEILPMVLFIQPDWMRYLNVRLDAAQLPETLRFIEQTWASFEAERPFDYFFLDEEFDGLYRSEARLSKIFAGFSFLAIFIACLGLFGLAAFVAEQRTKEIGIRKVLGATVSNIVLNLSKDFARWVLLANLIAWPLGFWLMNDWLAKFAYRIDIGWWMFALAGSMTLLVALLTVSTQAIRAALANPVEALKYE